MGILSMAMHDVVLVLEDLCSFLLRASPDTWPWADWKLWCGAAMWGSIWYHWLNSDMGQRYHVVAQFQWTATLVLGQNLAVLSMLQTMGPLGFFGLLAMVAANMHFTKKLFPARMRPEGDSFQAASMYEDLGAEMPQVTTIFVGQCVLLLFLVYSCYYNYEEKAEDTTFSFWTAAYVSVQMSGFFKRGGDSQVGRTWDLEKWRGIVAGNDRMEYRLANSNTWSTRTTAELKLRGKMGFMVNSFFRDIVMFITPILCMQSDDAVDFVQNCFALSYITTIDDIGDPREIFVRAREGFRDGDGDGDNIAAPLLGQ